MTLQKVNRQLLNKRRLPPQVVKNILQKAGIESKVTETGKVKITQSDLSLSHKQKRTAAQWVILIIHHLFYMGEKHISLVLSRRHDQQLKTPIVISIQQHGDRSIRTILLRVHSEPPSHGYGEGMTSEPFFLEKEFRIFEDRSMSRPCYPFLHLLWIILMRYNVAVPFMQQSVIHRFIRYHHDDVQTWKELQIRKPSFRKIETYQPSSNENQFLNILQYLFPPLSPLPPSGPITLHDFLERFPLLNQQLQDDGEY